MKYREVITYDDFDVVVDISYHAKKISSIEAKIRAINLICNKNQLYFKYNFDFRNLFWIVPLSIFIGILIQGI